MDFSNFHKNKYLRYGAPFFALVLGGSYILKYFSNIRYQYSRQKRITPEEAKEMGFTIKKPEELTMHSEFEKMQNLDIDNWKNIRGPRPWEEGNESVKPKKEQLKST